jgi:hypothetical protein
MNINIDDEIFNLKRKIEGTEYTEHLKGWIEGYNLAIKEIIPFIKDEFLIKILKEMKK